MSSSTTKTKKKWPVVVLLLALCLVIAIVPLATISDSEFGGADGEAEALITEIDPDYEPWATSVIELPGAETESLLFCVQAALGGIVLGYGFGYYRARSKYSNEYSKERDVSEVSPGVSNTDFA